LRCERLGVAALGRGRDGTEKRFEKKQSTTDHAGDTATHAFHPSQLGVLNGPNMAWTIETNRY
jgi:hypothetical protein